MESPLLGLILDSSVVIAAERKWQTVEELLIFVRQTFGEIEIAISAVTIAELVHGVVRAKPPSKGNSHPDMTHSWRQSCVPKLVGEVH